MREEFDVTLQREDMFKFNMYHTYHSFHGLFSVVLAVIVMLVTVRTWGETPTTNSALYIFLTIVILFYMPLNLWIHAKIQLQRSETLRNTQHFTVDEKGVTISQNGEEATLEWGNIYKAVETKSNILIYSSRVNAYVFPKRDLGASAEAVRTMLKEHLEKYRLKIK